ncbi:hypothetical protein K440DRAFT_664425 [Wilcoxina mikolae CBS 423.85]|nr:hypothetical protein K440DRAFT_664425 [Wilcoxina mikolae CBS 423.85]
MPMRTTKLSASEFADLASQLTNKTFEVPVTLIWTKRVKDPSAIKTDPLAHPLHTPANLNSYPKWRKNLDSVVKANFPSIEGGVTSLMKIGGDLGRHNNPLSTSAQTVATYWEAIYNDGKFGVVYILDPEKEDGLFSSGYGVRVRSQELYQDRVFGSHPFLRRDHQSYFARQQGINKISNFFLANLDLGTISSWDQRL